MLRCLVVLLVLAATGGARAEAPPIDGPRPLPLAAQAGGAPAPPWKVVGLPQQTKPFTRFSVVELDGVQALRIESDKAYGNVVHPLRLGGNGAHLSWQWRLDRPIASADLRRRRGDDMPVRVCVLFDMPIERVPSGERRMLRHARTKSGSHVPGATVCYVWDATLAAEEALDSPFTRRIRYLVVQSGSAPLQQWLSARRDVAADFRRLFGDEIDHMPPIMGVAVGADSDNTRSQSLAFVAKLVLEP